MKDELLTRAAQANGHPYPWVMPNGFGERPWNPLESNEDALVLAVRIGLQVTAYPMYDEPKHSVIVRKPVWDHDAQEGDGVEVVEPYGADALAATRRAITMCAAELARRKTPNEVLGPNVENVMKVELTKEWCMNMAKLEARAAELHEGCRMPMKQARELAASEASPEWYARGQDWGLADALTAGQEGDWTLDDIARAFAAGAQAGAVVERGAAGKNEVLDALADEVEVSNDYRRQLDQVRAEYEDMKSLLLGNARNLNLEGERAREHLRLAIDHIAALNGALEDLASLGATVAICGTKYDDAAARMVLRPNV